jgi:two-component system uhpT operon response regulator UhpA
MLKGIAQWLADDASDIDVTIQTGSWTGLFADRAFPDQADVVLLDISLGDTLPLIQKIKTLKTMGTLVVVMSTYADTSVIANALTAGASGYVSKAEDGHAMATAIRMARDGGTYLSDVTRAELAKFYLGSQSPKLSDQERKLMAAYGNGHQLKAISAELSISVETAKGYLKNVRAKYRSVGIDIGTQILLRKQALRDGIIARDTALDAQPIPVVSL